MKVHIPKIPLEALQEKELAKYRDLNDESYGEPLARKVAGKLMEHPSGLFHSHRDYCGIGLYFFEGKFTLGEVNDGMGPHPIMLTFDGKDEFIAWLADQSDQRMSLIAAVKDNYFSFKFNNQTITKTRLRYFLEADYSPDWNSYCAYFKETMKYTLALLLITIMTSAGAQDNDGWYDSYENCTEYVYGFINIEDKDLSIAAEYCAANAFAEGLAAVKKDGKWGFIDADNNAVIGFHYDYARNFNEGHAIVQQGEFYGVINKKGALVIPIHYYDLIPYELEGTRYYISRDSTFFQGIVDAAGKEVLPHRYAFVIPFEPNLAKRRFYSNIPFYTTYWEIDTAKGSFYKQFSEAYYGLAADSSRQDIYDAQFNRLASKQTTSYSDQFTHDELIAIDGYLEEHKEVDAERKRAAIRRLLDSKQAYTPKPHPAPEIVPTSEEGQNEYMALMGYEKFSGNDGKMGVKKDGKILLSARFDVLEWWGMVFPSPSKEDIPYLEEHYAGRYINKEERVFAVYGIAAGSKEEGALYTMKGVKVFDLESNTVPEEASSIGFTYRTIERDTARQRTTYKFGFVNWKGREILPAAYTRIKIAAENYLLVKREKESERGKEAHFGLYNASGEAIIPEGVFSNIEPFADVPNLYLAEWNDAYPTLAEQEAAETANKQFVLLRVKEKTYTVINQFTASVVDSRGLAIKTGMLKYRKNKEE